jgi:hypothetical protein
MYPQQLPVAPSVPDQARALAKAEEEKKNEAA